MRKKTVLVQAVLATLFSALISAGAFIQIPLPSGVPLVIQDMMVLLSGILLGPLWGSFSVLLFLILGIIGLPVFSGKAGIQVLLSGPTGGFLIGYLAAAFCCGILVHFLVKKQGGKLYWLKLSIVAILGTIVLFVFGVAGFMRITDASYIKTITLVVVPFIPGNIIKAVLLVLLSGKFLPIIKNYVG